MGRIQEQLTVTAYLSNHNDPQDEADEKAWNELRERVKALVYEARYVGIDPSVD